MNLVVFAAITLLAKDSLESELPGRSRRISTQKEEPIEESLLVFTWIPSFYFLTNGYKTQLGEPKFSLHGFWPKTDDLLPIRPFNRRELQSDSALLKDLETRWPPLHSRAFKDSISWFSRQWERKGVHYELNKGLQGQNDFFMAVLTYSETIDINNNIENLPAHSNVDQVSLEEFAFALKTQYTKHVEIVCKQSGQTIELVNEGDDILYEIRFYYRYLNKKFQLVDSHRYTRNCISGTAWFFTSNPVAATGQEVVEDISVPEEVEEREEDEYIEEAEVASEREELVTPANQQLLDVKAKRSEFRKLYNKLHNDLISGITEEVAQMMQEWHSDFKKINGSIKRIEDDMRKKPEQFEDHVQKLSSVMKKLDELIAKVKAVFEKDLSEALQPREIATSTAQADVDKLERDIEDFRERLSLENRAASQFEHMFSIVIKSCQLIKNSQQRHQFLAELKIINETFKSLNVELKSMTSHVKQIASTAGNDLKVISDELKKLRDRLHEIEKLSRGVSAIFVYEEKLTESVINNIKVKAKYRLIEDVFKDMYSLWKSLSSSEAINKYPKSQIDGIRSLFDEILNEISSLKTNIMDPDSDITLLWPRMDTVDNNLQLLRSFISDADPNSGRKDRRIEEQQAWVERVRMKVIVAYGECLLQIQHLDYFPSQMDNLWGYKDPLNALAVGFHTTVGDMSYELINGPKYLGAILVKDSSSISVEELLEVETRIDLKDIHYTCSFFLEVLKYAQKAFNEDVRSRRNAVVFRAEQLQLLINETKALFTAKIQEILNKPKNQNYRLEIEKELQELNGIEAALNGFVQRVQQPTENPLGSLKVILGLIDKYRSDIKAKNQTINKIMKSAKKKKK